MLNSDTTDMNKIASAMIILEHSTAGTEDNISTDTLEFLKAFEDYREVKKRHLLGENVDITQVLEHMLNELSDIIDGVKLSAPTENEQQTIRRYLELWQK